MENYFHSLFFEKLYTKLTGLQTRDSDETYNEFESFITMLFDAADNIANKLNASQEVNLDYLLALFENFSKDDISYGVRWERKYKISQSSITKIIADLLIIFNIKDNKLNEENIKKLLNFEHFHKDN